VKSAQNLGFSLDEIIDLLRLEDGAHCLILLLVWYPRQEPKD
jgi:DNA-binding transcriptional MerR regulator